MKREKAKLGDYDYTGISVIHLENSEIKQETCDVVANNGWPVGPPPPKKEN